MTRVPQKKPRREHRVDYLDNQLPGSTLSAKQHAIKDVGFLTGAH